MRLTRPRTGQRRHLAVLITAVLAVGGLAPMAQALIGDGPARTWGIGPATSTSASEGTPRVLAILPVGDRIYVGGTFNSVIDPSGVSYPVKNLAVFSASTGAADLTFAATANNTVTSLASDGGSTLFVGGTFTTVNGAARRGLAALTASSGALKAWAPTVTTGQVDSVAYSAGSVYAAGNFTSVTGPGTSSLPFVAKISEATGAVDTAWNPTPNGRVRALTVAADGSVRLFIAGDFTAVSGRSGTNKLAAVSLTGAGAVDVGFRAAATNGTSFAPIFDVISDQTRVYVAVAGSGGACAALSATSGTLAWSDHSNGNMQSVRLSGGRLYCGGHFSGTASFVGQDRQKLAAVDPATGAVTDFNPQINSSQGVWALATDASHVYIGGDFSLVSGVEQPHFAMLTDSAAWTAPRPPSAVLAQPGDRIVRLSWAPPSNDGGSPLLNYKVYRSTTPGGQDLTKAPLATVSKSVLTYDDRAVANATTYYYVVVATNAVGASLRSSQASATPTGSDTVTRPGAPTSVSVANTLGKNHLQWNAPVDNGGAPVTSYRVYRGTAPGAEDFTTPVGTTSATYFDDEFGLTAGTTYYYRVSAVNQAGEGTPSAEVFTTATAGVPGPARLDATLLAGPAVRLSWSVPPDGGSPITKYVILRDAVRLVSLDATTGGGPTTYTDSTVVRRATHTYQVKAVNVIGSGQLSNKAVVTIP